MIILKLTKNTPESYTKSLDLKNNKELSDFFHDLKHDLQNHLAAIDGYVHLLKEENNILFLDKIHKNVKNMFELLKRSVSYTDIGLHPSSIGKIQLESFIINISKNVIPKNINFVCECANVVISTNKKDFGLLLTNLLSNAIEHARATWIKIEGTKSESKDFIKLIISYDGDIMTTERFHTIIKQRHSIQKKSGFGLAIIHKLAELYDWEMSISSNSHTIYEFQIPIN